MCLKNAEKWLTNCLGGHELGIVCFISFSLGNFLPLVPKDHHEMNLLYKLSFEEYFYSDLKVGPGK